MCVMFYENLFSVPRPNAPKFGKFVVFIQYKLLRKTPATPTRPPH